ncbi:metabotropic glutamate receptor-like [Anneissia japonica]|uniref:metabotropic glutamate receptor-like n=1 Tax=Anneissia japonica TaxID=1529436 RepID=UPI00142571B5|nr:metabotropic glutamate receptor-like [Anneissia japonica]XP_033122461.1 metabotropic glutamate receptor-like [Anneissia japonica]XP_033122462.1 metabotropic glutamate receptor-like [Anneissia japonica]XP_033122463.1 metabotropic glutamate receptor-like [Anneissia japonica]XP_033122464.1 metabotropic glutamate receptor-like [Anneissia japonica]XP_033122465.1 metabotropic glutamate receptor-like [Anneissia japonica]
MEDRYRLAHLRMHVTVIFIICARSFCVGSVSRNANNSFTHYFKKGDVVLGGLFSFYQEIDGNCSTLNDLHGAVGRIEAMIYAIEKINNNTNILPNLTLGYSIYDDCGQESFGLASSLHLLGLERTSCCPGSTQYNMEKCDTPPILGVIGPEYTKVTIATNHLFSFYQVPHISASASSDELSDSNRFPFFSRLVPSDSFQIGAMIDIIEHFKWKYVSAVYSNEDYGEHGINELIDRSHTNDKFCLGAIVGISESATNVEIDRAIRQIEKQSHVEVLILFSLPRASQMFLDGMKRRNLIGSYTMIGSDATISLVSNPDYFGLLKGSLFLNPYSSQRLPSFDKHINEVAKAAEDNVSSTENPFLQTIVNGCKRDAIESMCAELNRTKSANFSLNTWAAIVMDAVNVMALALNTTLEGKYDKINEGYDISAIVGDFHTNILKTSFRGTRGFIQFMENGDFMGSYVIENIQEDGNEFDSIVVGQWNSQNETKLSLFDEDIQWPFDHVPRSYCSSTCLAGYVTREHNDNPQCCWECSKCHDYEITSANGTACLACPEFHWPDVNQTSCELVDPTFLHKSDSAAIAFLFLTSLGLTISLITSVMYIYLRNKPLIKASGRETMFIIMLGVILSYVMVFFFVSEPSTSVCGVARIGLIITFTWIYAPLLVKVFRINRIFYLAKKSPQKPKYIAASYQVLFSIILISVQLVISIMWLTIKAPRAEKHNPVLYQREVTLSCNFQQGEIITSSMYNLILIGLCCYYAIRTRKLPDNFKETKFIGVIVYTTMFIFVAFIPSYFVVTEPVTRVAILSIAVVCNASTTLVCLFLSKLYAVYFVIDGNEPGTRTSGVPIAHCNNKAAVVGDFDTVKNETVSTENTSSAV